MFFFTALGVMMASAMLPMMGALPITSHFGWLLSLWEERLSKPYPTLARRFWLLLAGLTPVLGFYAVRMIDRIQDRDEPPPATEWWRWLLPVMSCLTVLAASQIIMPYPTSDMLGMPGFMGRIFLLGAYYLFGAGIAHMAATVFALTKRGLWTSRSQLLPMSIVAAILLPVVTLI